MGRIMTDEQAVRKVCEDYGFTLSVHNGGRHWQIRMGRKILLQWYPGNGGKKSGRLVDGEDFTTRNYIHNIEDLCECITTVAWRFRPARELQKQFDHLADIAPTQGLKVIADPSLLVRLQGRHWPCPTPHWLKPAGGTQAQIWYGGI